MASRINQMSTAFRQTFNIDNMKNINWFPGHMAKGIMKFIRID